MLVAWFWVFHGTENCLLDMILTNSIDVKCLNYKTKLKISKGIQLTEVDENSNLFWQLITSLWNFLCK